MRRGDLADLTAFVAVAEKRSFRSAAERLSVTPSALSHTIRQLEQRLGVRRPFVADLIGVEAAGRRVEVAPDRPRAHLQYRHRARQARER